MVAVEIVENCIISARPSKVFSALGKLDEDIDATINSYKKLVAKIRKEFPNAAVYVLSVPSVNAIKIALINHL